MAFTLMELVVVIAIIGVVVGLGVPLMRAMMRGSAETSGVNTIAIAAETARRLATATRNMKDPLADGGPSSGTALIVTNSGEVRLVQHTNAEDVVDATNGKAYVDVINRDYISLSKRTGIVGIKRNGADEDDLDFVAPPFAVRFNAQGNLVFGDPDKANGLYAVYYDGDYDGEYDAGRDRPNGYDPALTAFSNWNTTEHKYELPFDAIETVVGVMVFDNTDIPFLAAGAGDPYIRGDSEAGRLLLEHGTAVFFNRVTGAPVFRN